MNASIIQPDPNIEKTMKKATILALALIMPVVAALASPVDKEAAKATATAFLQQKVASASGRHNAPKQLNLVSAQEENAPYYVFNNTNGQGFAIVSGEDTANQPILGYSTEGSLTEENMPEALRAILSDYAKVVEFAQQNGLSMKRAPRKVTRANVAPIIEFNWDQGLPYCNMTPEANNDKGRCSLGCMAVTVAMIVAHYEYPTGLPGHSNGNYRSDYYEYNYSSFRSSYDKSDTNLGEMPQFMYHVANLLNTNYNADGSSATESQFIPTMTQYLGYNANMKSIMRDAYSAEQWEEIIYNELAAGRPVNFLGSHPDLGGHSYICDGYQSSDGFYHMNWGWNGTCNGYFEMSVLNPFVSYFGNWGAMGYTVPPGGFNEGLKAIIGIQPELIEGSSIQLLTTDDIINDGNGVRVTLFNWNADRYRGSMSLAILNEDNSFTMIESAPVRSINLTYHESSYQNFDIASFGLADGIYKLVPISKTNEEGSEWNLCEGYNQKYIEVRVGGGRTSFVTHPVTDVVAEALTFNYNANTGNVQGTGTKYMELLLKLQNYGDDVYGFLTIEGTRDGETTKLYGTKIDIGMKAGQTLSLSVFLDNGGTSSTDYNHVYEVTVKYKQKDIGTFTIRPWEYPGTTQISYTGADFENYEPTSSRGFLYSTTLKGNVNIKNTKGNNYLVPIKITLKEYENYTYTEVFSQTVVDYLNAYETKGYPIEIKGLQAGKTYYMDADLIKMQRSGGTYSDKVVKNFFKNFPLEVVANVPYYTADGTLEHQVASSSGLIDLPANTSAVDFRDFDPSSVNFNSITNPNCIYVFESGVTIPDELEGKNVVVGNAANKIALVEGYPVVFPVDIDAEEITFTRTFTKGNNGDDTGWETIVLPFYCHEVYVGDVNEANRVDWFHNKTENGRKFWLYKYVGGSEGEINFGYEDSKDVSTQDWFLNRDEPYIIAVPGNKWGDYYDLSNKPITFRATHANWASVKANSSLEKKAGFYTLKGTYCNANLADVYVLNSRGDFFEKEESVIVNPFNAYFTGETSTTSKLNISFDAVPTAIIAVDNDQYDNVKIFDLQGRRVQNAQKGIYIQNGKKVVIK